MQACSDSPPGEEPMMSGIWRWTSNYETQWRTGIFMPAKGLLLKTERHAVPVL